MNRWTAIPSARTNFLPGEFQLTSLESVRLDDADKKTQFSNGELCLTSHRIIWSNPSILSSDLVLPLHLVILVEEEQSLTVNLYQPQFGRDVRYLQRKFKQDILQG